MFRINNFERSVRNIFPSYLAEKRSDILISRKIIETEFQTFTEMVKFPRGICPPKKLQQSNDRVSRFATITHRNESWKPRSSCMTISPVYFLCSRCMKNIKSMCVLIRCDTLFILYIFINFKRQHADFVAQILFSENSKRTSADTLFANPRSRFPWYLVSILFYTINIRVPRNAIFTRYSRHCPAYNITQERSV